MQRQSNNHYERLTSPVRRTDLEEGLSEEYPYFLEQYPAYVVQDNNFNPQGYGNIEAMLKEDAWYQNINYLYKNPYPNQNTIVFNNRVINPQRAVNLDYLHVLRREDPYYKQLLLELHNVLQRNDEIMYSAKLRYEEDKKKNKGKEVMPFYRYVENEVDGWLRNMFHGGSPKELKQDKYYPYIDEMLERNQHLIDPTRNIYNYLHPTELPEIVIMNKQGGKLIPKKRYIK